MKKYIFSLLLACAVFAGCSKSDSDVDVVPEQNVLLSSFRLNENGQMEPEVFRFLFFKNDFPYGTGQYRRYCNSYEEYTQLEEDPIYSELMNDEFSKKIPLFAFTDDQTIAGKQMQVKLPVGYYVVFAFRQAKDSDKRLWNKYGCANIVIEPNKEPQIVKCILPVDYTFTGRSCDTDLSLAGHEEWILWPEKK